jgi:hypothetical protein
MKFDALIAVDVAFNVYFIPRSGFDRDRVFFQHQQIVTPETTDQPQVCFMDVNRHGRPSMAGDSSPAKIPEKKTFSRGYTALYIPVNRATVYLPEIGSYTALYI